MLSTWGQPARPHHEAAQGERLRVDARVDDLDAPRDLVLRVVVRQGHADA